MAAKDVVLRKHHGQFYYELDYDVIIFFGLTELQAYLEWKTRVGRRSASPTFYWFDYLFRTVVNDGESKCVRNFIMSN